MELSNTAKFAKRELDILVQTVDKPIISPFIPEIISLVNKFGKSGQSGGSAPLTATAIAQAVKKLCLQEPICDITGIDDEWMDVAEYMGENKGSIFQNTRCGAIFKEGKDGRPYYLDAMIFKTPEGHTYSSNCGAICKDGSKVYSRNYIKSFPFKPKTFYIDVIEEEIAKDDWVFYIKNERQLNRVWKYYDRYSRE